MMACGSSLRGLSLVSTTRSARRSAIAPICGACRDRAHHRSRRHKSGCRCAQQRFRARRREHFPARPACGHSPPRSAVPACRPALHASRRRPNAAQRRTISSRRSLRASRAPITASRLGDIEAAHHRRGKAHAAQIERDAGGAHAQVFGTQIFIGTTAVNLSQCIADGAGASAALSLAASSMPTGSSG